MSLKIRLAKNRRSSQSFRIVVCETRSKRDGKTIDLLGFCTLGQKTSDVSLDKNKYDQWLAKGAKPTETVRKMIK